MSKKSDQNPVSEQDEQDAGKRPMRTARAAVAMRIAGASDVEIAEALDYVTPGAARAAWENAIASTADPGSDYKSLRRLMTARLEAGMKSLAPRALNEYVWEPDPSDPSGKKRRRVRNEDHLGYSQLFLRYLDRLARLQGLDAPQVVSFVSPDVQEFERVVSEMAAISRGDQAEEGDIFEEGPDGTFQAKTEPEPEPETEEEPDAY